MINAKHLVTPILKNICARMVLKIYPVLLFYFFSRYVRRSSSICSISSSRYIRTSEKLLGEHRSLFSIKLQNFSLKFIKLKAASRIFFIEFCKIFILRRPFLQDTSGRLLLIFRKYDIQNFNC